jgi:hypothetical protein
VPDRATRKRSKAALLVRWSIEELNVTGDSPFQRFDALTLQQ